ncbi:MAG: HD domain-containing protein, partial [Planctomycetota bacterium]
LQHDHDSTSLKETLTGIDARPDRFHVFQALLLPLENVTQSRRWHPEGDALYHSLQVFGLAKDVAPYDEEFLLAALLHDVGKAIDPGDHVVAGLEALEGFITARTAWLIANHMEAHKIAEHTIGARRRRRLASHPSYEELLSLGECDRGGRRQGVQVDSVDEALDYIEGLEDMFGH